MNEQLLQKLALFMSQSQHYFIQSAYVEATSTNFNQLSKQLVILKNVLLEIDAIFKKNDISIVLLAKQLNFFFKEIQKVIDWLLEIDINGWFD